VPGSDRREARLPAAGERAEGRAGEAEQVLPPGAVPGRMTLPWPSRPPANAKETQWATTVPATASRNARAGGSRTTGRSPRRPRRRPARPEAPPRLRRVSERGPRPTVVGQASLLVLREPGSAIYFGTWDRPGSPPRRATWLLEQRGTTAGGVVPDRA